MKNEKVFLYIFVFIGIVTISSLFGNLVQQGRIQRLRLELESVRTELISARDRERIATSTIADIRDGLGRADEICRKSTRTVEDIRRNIHKLEEIFNEMENIINNHGYNNSGINNNVVEEIKE